MDLSRTMPLDELEGYDPNVYWSVLDELEVRGIADSDVAEVEIVELLGGMEATVRGEDGDVLFILDMDPEGFVIEARSE